MDTEPRVEDIMLSKFETITGDATVREAVLKLCPSESRGVECYPETKSLVVVTKEGDLDGLLTMVGILKSLEPIRLRDEHFHLAGLTWAGFFEDAVDMIENKRVAETMTPAEELETVSPGDRLVVAIERMIERPFAELPVCDNGRKVVGIIRLIDVFNQVAREMLAQEG